MRLAVYGVLATVIGCAPATRPGGATPKSAERQASSDPERVTLARTVITPGSEGDIDELFAKAVEAQRLGKAKAAADGFDRVYRLDPDGPRAAEALYQGGLAHEQAGDRTTSVQRFEQVTTRFPKHALSRESLLRAIRLLCFLERWQRCGEASAAMLTRYADLDHIESIVAFGGKGLALVAAGDLEAATYNIEKARTIVEEHRLDAAGTLSRDVAQLYFALGEVRRARAEKILFNPLPSNFGAVLEQRCQLLLDAQSAYSDTMRAKDAHWSAMSGFRVGELYAKLHEDLMDVRQPKADNEKKQQLFEGAMRLRYSILLDKALSMMEHTLSMSARTGEKSGWVSKAEDARAKLARARKAENDAIDKLPYTRAQLQQALDDLAKKAEAQAKAAAK
ncbi:MAG: hypothetical protein IPI67_20375 [Myxococcales bacterium]|nr:hypothetical protein [Myxococcales bacterium]